MRKLEGASLRTYTRGLGVKVQTTWTQFKRSILIFTSIALILGPLSLMSQTVQAAQITSRSLTISSAIQSATGVTYTFNFTPGQVAAVQAFTIQLCTAAVGACTTGSVPAGVNISGGSISSLGGTWQGSPSGAAKDTTTSSAGPNAVDCTKSYDFCYTFTDGTNQTQTNHTITITGVTNPSTVGTFYARITTYTTTAYAAIVDSGNVAAATTQTFTVNAVVQESLTFCVGSVNGNSTTVESVTYALPACGSLPGSSLSLGTLTTADVSVSPVPTSQPANGDLNNGVAELTTNAAGGTTVSYNAVSQGSGAHAAALRVPSATCTAGTSYTDQCINSLTAGTTITAGTEDFGMAIPGINCHNVPSVVYTCSATAHSLTVQSPYYCTAADAGNTNGSFYNTDAGGQDAGPTTCTYAWDDSGTSETVATSSGVVGGEGLILEFAATPELTTPTGSYSAEANFVATPTF